MRIARFLCSSLQCHGNIHFTKHVACQDIKVFTTGPQLEHQITKSPSMVCFLCLETGFNVFERAWNLKSSNGKIERSVPVFFCNCEIFSANNWTNLKKNTSRQASVSWTKDKEPKKSIFDVISHTIFAVTSSKIILHNSIGYHLNVSDLFGKISSCVNRSTCFAAFDALFDGSARFFAEQCLLDPHVNCWAIMCQDFCFSCSGAGFCHVLGTTILWYKLLNVTNVTRDVTRKKTHHVNAPWLSLLVEETKYWFSNQRFQLSLLIIIVQPKRLSIETFHFNTHSGMSWFSVGFAFKYLYAEHCKKSKVNSTCPKSACYNWLAVIWRLEPKSAHSAAQLRVCSEGKRATHGSIVHYFFLTSQASG